MSRASTSVVRRAKAFFDPSGLSFVSQLGSLIPLDQNLPNQSIDLDSFNIIQILQRRLDLPLVRLDVHNEHQRIILLDLLHRTLGIQRVNDDFVLIETSGMRDRLAWVLGRSGELKSLGSVEGC